MVTKTKLAGASLFLILSFFVMTSFVSALNVNYALSSEGASIRSLGGDGGTLYGSRSNILDGDLSTGFGLTSGFGWRTFRVSFDEPKNLTKVRVLTTHNEYGYLVAYDLSIQYINGSSQLLNKVYEGHPVVGLDFEGVAGAVGSVGNWKNVVSITFHMNGKADYGANELEAWGSVEEAPLVIDNDGDGYNESVDCDDNNADVHPYALEVCNGIDDNCDGFIDEDCLVADTTAPSSVSNLQMLAKGGDWISWIWDNPSDVDFLESLIFIDGVNVLNSSLEEYILSGLLENSSHTIEIFTSDNSSNINTRGVSSTVTTDFSGGEDTTAPGSVSNLKRNSYSYNRISWIWDNPSDVDFLEAIIYLDGVNVKNTSDEYYQATDLEEDSWYTIKIYTIDNSSNINTMGVSSTVKTSVKDDDDDDDSKTSEPVVKFFPGKESLSLGKINQSDTILLGTYVASEQTKINWLWILFIGIIILVILILVALIVQR